MTRQYLVTYEHSHVHYNSHHQKEVSAQNAKEACQMILDEYYTELDRLYARRGTCRNASKYGVYYPFHRKAKRLD